MLWKTTLPLLLTWLSATTSLCTVHGFSSSVLPIMKITRRRSSLLHQQLAIQSPDDHHQATTIDGANSTTTAPKEEEKEESSPLLMVIQEKELGDENNNNSNNEEECWLDENNNMNGGDNCRIIEYDHEEENSQFSLVLDEILKWKPITLPVIAFVMYDPTAKLFATTLSLLGNNNWVAVDGGAYQAKIIAPAVNGVVMPAISILFATMIGTTITTLRQRQADIQLSLQMEATLLRVFQHLLDHFPHGPMVDKCRQYMFQYTSRLLAEGNEAVNLEALEMGGMDSELNGILAQLNRATIDNFPDEPIPPLILDQACQVSQKMNEERAKRMTALQSTFPALHYVVLLTLALSILIAFLMETDQDILVFLNAIQLRLLWSILVGTFSALGFVLYDLNNPFRGSYQVSKAVDQLYALRSEFELALQLQQQKQRQRQRQRQQAEEKENSSSSSSSISALTTTTTSTTTSTWQDVMQSSTRQDQAWEEIRS